MPSVLRLAIEKVKLFSSFLLCRGILIFWQGSMHVTVRRPSPAVILSAVSRSPECSEGEGSSRHHTPIHCRVIHPPTSHRAPAFQRLCCCSQATTVKHSCPHLNHAFFVFKCSRV